MKSNVKKRILLPVAVLALIVLAVAVGLFMNRGKATSMHLVRTEGSVLVRDGAGQALTIRDNLSLYDGHAVGTEDQSYAWIDLDKVKLTKLDENSDVTVHKDGKKLELVVNAGSLFFNVTEPLQDDESMEIRSSNLFVGIRGTCGWVQLMQENCMRLYLLKGEVHCAVRDDAGNELVSQTVTPGQMAELVYDGENSSITVTEFSAIPDFVRTELDQTDLPDETGDDQTVSAEAIYQPILDEYSAAMGKGYVEEGEFPHINELMVSMYHWYGGPQEGATAALYYDYYDLDGNGTEELLIGYGTDTDPIGIVDLYGVQNQTFYKLVDEYSLGERTQATVYSDGSIVLTGSGGYDSVYVEAYRFKEDGMLNSPEVIVDTTSAPLEGDVPQVVAEYLGGLQPVTDFDWQPIVPKQETDSFGDLAGYIGVYMNGNDWNAGRLTITARDAESVTVRLEAARTRSEDISTIFEGIGYAAADGLTVDLSGRQVKLTRGDVGLWLEADSSLRDEWALDPYVFDAQYASTAVPGN